MTFLFENPVVGAVILSIAIFTLFIISVHVLARLLVGLEVIGLIRSGKAIQWDEALIKRRNGEAVLLIENNSWPRKVWLVRECDRAERVPIEVVAKKLGLIVVRPPKLDEDGIALYGLTGHVVNGMYQGYETRLG